MLYTPSGDKILKKMHEIAERGNPDEMALVVYIIEGIPLKFSSKYTENEFRHVWNNVYRQGDNINNDAA